MGDQPVRMPLARVLSLLLIGAIIAQPAQLLLNSMGSQRSAAHVIKKPISRTPLRVRSTVPAAARGREIALAGVDRPQSKVVPLTSCRPSQAAFHLLGSLHTASSPPLRC